MQRIDTVFKRDMTSRPPLVYDEVVEGTEWVLRGEGVATRKWDGTACMVKDGVLYKRLHLKQGNLKPGGWRHWSGDPEQVHGHGWIPVGDGPDDKWHREGGETSNAAELSDGTYELCGPRIGKNPEKLSEHGLIRHGQIVLSDCPHDFDGIREFLRCLDAEGVVWWGPDGLKAKIKVRDFGFRRGG